jgi:Tfp pilus assembly protein PilN
MPRVCQSIKNHRTAGGFLHSLLTALTQQRAEIKGLKNECDDFLDDRLQIKVCEKG